ncbi:hypothetical protein HYQ45_002087 [Verticillium longisporum]|uniref:Uncharacterized protein n=1 Tax=Verticillium longisporum TaxID=100787 RepID=A0A8I3AWK0_VERLO|nr:hypothetical protein HYQ45_002087 [Verticillium longisporum]
MFFHCRRKQRPPSVFPRTPCARLGCNRRALRCESHERGIIFYSFYCKDHACRHRAGNVMCPNHKQAGETRYCEDHTRCRAQNCSRPRKAADRNETWAYCLRHTCLLDGCYLKRAPDSQICAAPDCDAVIAAGAWCRSHTPCRVTGCTRPRAVLPHTSGGARDAVCAEHAPRACRRGGCTAVLDGAAEQQRIFCAAHECLRVDCRGGRQDTTADGGGVFCEAHACEKPLCGEPVVAAAEGARYCQGHECRVAECRGPRAVDSLYCPLLHASSSGSGGRGRDTILRR